jgi:hypothetical protein
MADIEDQLRLVRADCIPGEEFHIIGTQIIIVILGKDTWN